MLDFASYDMLGCPFVRQGIELVLVWEVSPVHLVLHKPLRASQFDLCLSLVVVPCGDVDDKLNLRRKIISKEVKQK